MKAVLLSVQPKWCELIASGKKTVEVRKTKPKLLTPFKCYIYQTRKTWVYNIYSRIADWQGKVIGEFVCDAVDRMAHCGTCNSDIRLKLVDKNLYCKELDYEYLNKCKLSYFDIDKYSSGGDVYGWHISGLVIYDKPKELSEFVTVDNEAVKNCECRERIYNNPDFTNGAMLLGSYLCKDKMDWCIKCKTKPITRPPQSWCYVERSADDV